MSVQSRPLCLAAALMAVAVLALPAALVSTASAQDRWGWDDDDNDRRRPHFPRHGHDHDDDEEPVLVLRARGFIGAVLADGLATHPRLQRRYEIRRVDSDARPLRDADYVVVISAMLERGTEGRYIVVLTQVDGESGEVLDGHRLRYNTIGDAFDDLCHLGHHLGSLSEGPVAPEPPPGEIGVPDWFTQPVRQAGYVSAVAEARHPNRDEAQRQAVELAESEIESHIGNAARTAVERFFARRGRRVNLSRADVEVHGHGFDTHRERQLPDRGSVGARAFAEVRVDQEHAMEDVMEAAEAYGQVADRRIRLDETEIQAYALEYLAEQGFDLDAPPAEQEEPITVGGRRELGNGWCEYTLAVSAGSVGEATTMAQDWGCRREATDEIRASFDRLSRHSHFAAALAAYAPTTLQRVEEHRNGRVTVHLTLRVAATAFQQWAGRALADGTIRDGR